MEEVRLLQLVAEVLQDLKLEVYRLVEVLLDEIIHLGEGDLNEEPPVAAELLFDPKMSLQKNECRLFVQLGEQLGV